MAAILASHGSAQFNDRLWADVERIADDVEKLLGTNLLGLALGGGYGRGEGGVVQDDAGVEHPYNDMDFTLIVRDVARIPAAGLVELSHSHTQRMGIDIDFSRPLTLEALQSLPHWMMWHDLVNGHIMVRGAGDLLTTHVPAMLSDPIPQTEGLRLLLNRGAGLLWALRITRGLDTAHDGDFCRRNLQKLHLALGDALLVSVRKYPTRCSGRAELLVGLRDQLPVELSQDLVARYQTALTFKFSPHKVSQAQPSEAALLEAAQLWGQVLVATESVRTGKAFATAGDYVAWKGLREPELSSARCWLANAVRQLRGGRLSLRYPREFLYTVLPQLLVVAPASTPHWAARSNYFMQWWKRYN